MDMSVGMWVMAGVMMGMMLIAMVGVAWGALRRRLRGRERRR